MSTNYTGNPAATQAPGPAITPGAVPIVQLPADGDSLAAASVAQLAKESADFIAYLMSRSRAIYNGTAPSGLLGNGAGTVGPPTFSIAGNDIVGLITVNTGTALSTSTAILFVTFNVAFSGTNAPQVFLQAANVAASGLSGTNQISLTTSQTAFTLTSGSVNLAASTQYKWSYLTKVVA